jgi:hypothetical protein
MKRTQMSRRPSKAKREFDAEYAAVLPSVLARGCEFTIYANPCMRPNWAADDWRGCVGPLRGHHAIGRDRAFANDPENLRCLCDLHHLMVHSHPRWSREVGLMLSRVAP